MVNADNSPQTVALNSSQDPSNVLPHEHQELEKQRRLHLIQLRFIKALAILLAIQGVWHLSNSIKFIFIDLPSLEQQLSLGQIDDFQINAFANRAIFTTTSTVLSLFFALRITIVQSKVAKAVSVTLAVLLVVGNLQINNFLDQIGSRQIISSTIIETFRSILSF